jgi:hypothetical protein
MCVVGREEGESEEGWDRSEGSEVAETLRYTTFKAPLCLDLTGVACPQAQRIRGGAVTHAPKRKVGIGEKKSHVIFMSVHVR